MVDRVAIETVWISRHIAVQDSVAALEARGLWPARRVGGAWVAPHSAASARVAASSPSGTSRAEAGDSPAQRPPSAPGGYAGGCCERLR